MSGTRWLKEGIGSDSESTVDSVSETSSDMLSSESSQISKAEKVREFLHSFHFMVLQDSDKQGGLHASVSTTSTVSMLLGAEEGRRSPEVMPSILEQVKFAKIKKVYGSDVILDGDDSALESRSQTPRESPREGDIPRSKSFSELMPDHDGHYRPSF